MDTLKSYLLITFITPDACVCTFLFIFRKGHVKYRWHSYEPVVPVQPKKVDFLTNCWFTSTSENLSFRNQIPLHIYLFIDPATHLPNHETTHTPNHPATHQQIILLHTHVPNHLTTHLPNHEATQMYSKSLSCTSTKSSSYQSTNLPHLPTYHIYQSTTSTNLPHLPIYHIYRSTTSTDLPHLPIYHIYQSSTSTIYKIIKQHIYQIILQHIY
jgi:hypothetical protein